MSDQIPMPATVLEHLRTEMIGQEIDGLIIRSLLGFGNTAVTYEVEDTNGIPAGALKLVTCESYGNRAPFREIGRFAQVEDERFLVLPKRTGDWSLELGGKKYEFIWFLSRCVKGQTLRDFLESNIRFSAKTEIHRYVEHLTAALDELQRVGFSHGDLHDRNIMREVVGARGRLPETRYVIIDFSEAHPVEATEEGLKRIPLKQRKNQKI